MKLSGKHIIVAGLGLHGGAVGNIRWLHSQGAKLTVTDLKTEAELAASRARLVDLTGIEWILGEHRKIDFTKADLILRNPGMPANSPYLEAARLASVPVEMDSSLFWQHSLTKNIIGVTGSKGKTTAASALAHFMPAPAGGRIVAIGVDGVSPLEKLDEIKPKDLVVFELSSWRLEALAAHKVSPGIAIVTSLYRDHLNTYASWDEYVAAKKNIMLWQKPDGLVVLNADDEQLLSWNDDAKGQVAYFSLSDKIPGNGICVVDEVVTVIDEGKKIQIFPKAELVASDDNAYRNILPAVYLAWRAGALPDDIRSQSKSLPKLPHRLEFVKEVEGVTYVNDSAATIPDATMAAIDAFNTKEKVLILGGSDKQLDFTDLATKISQANIRGIVFLPGNITEKMHQEIKNISHSSFPIKQSSSMAEAVRQAHALARSGDVVILSPGATSFQYFKHEFDRGDQFKEAVHVLDGV